ncbi:MAG: hypothetical protein E7434_01405 [Ruminococcaceae bacterium]|nr:hypothetical protein [Oscillospiraceae bacterium]
MAQKFRSNGSAAYDIFAVHNHTARPLEKPEHLPEAPVLPVKKVRFKLSVSPFAIFGTATAVLMLLLVIFSYVSMFEVRNDIGDLKSEKAALAEQQEKLRSQYESSIDLSSIEERALALGLHQPTAENVRYVRIGEENTTQVFSTPEDRNIFEQIYDAFRDVFSDVAEYFS